MKIFAILADGTKLLLTGARFPRRGPQDIGSRRSSFRGLKDKKQKTVLVFVRREVTTVLLPI